MTLIVTCHRQVGFKFTAVQVTRSVEYTGCFNIAAAVLSGFKRSDGAMPDLAEGSPVPLAPMVTCEPDLDGS